MGACLSTCFVYRVLRTEYYREPHSYRIVCTTNKQTVTRSLRIKHPRIQQLMSALIHIQHRHALRGLLHRHPRTAAHTLLQRGLRLPRRQHRLRLVRPNQTQPHGGRQRRLRVREQKHVARYIQRDVARATHEAPGDAEVPVRPRIAVCVEFGARRMSGGERFGED